MSDSETVSEVTESKFKRKGKPLLEASGLCKVYSGRKVVTDVGLNVGPGEIVGLLGPNGAGKTTTFYMVAGLVRPDAGSVSFSDQEVTNMPMHQRARLGMGYLPQEESIFRSLTVTENLIAVLETRKELSKSDRKERAEALMERFGITKLRNSKALSLSGGEKRRLTIARALATEPRILLLDEPFSGVDPIAVGDIQRIVTELREKEGLAILITDHNVRETLHIVDRAYLLFDGKLIQEGTAEDLISDPLARKHYLGEQFKL